MLFLPPSPTDKKFHRHKESVVIAIHLPSPTSRTETRGGFPFVGNITKGTASDFSWVVTLHPSSSGRSFHIAMFLSALSSRVVTGCFRPSLVITAFNRVVSMLSFSV